MSRHSPAAVGERPESLVDDADALRPDDGFDISRVDAWLKRNLDGLEGAPEVRQFRGGASNLTYLIRYPERSLVLRRPPTGQKAKSAHDMAREFQVQRALKPAYPAVPEMLALCQDEEVLGADFYVMEHLVGIIPRANLPRGLTLTPEQTRELCLATIDKLVELHAVDYQAANLAHIGKGKGYVKRQIEGWSDRSEKARTWNAPRWRYVKDWLVERMPEDVATVVVHNDFRFDNVVLDPDDPSRIIGVLDWEMATLGDPLMDLGNSLAYWVEAGDDRVGRSLRRQPTHLPGMLKRREVVEYYCEKTGHRPENWTFYEVYGLFRLSVIAQQIYFRYHHGQTTNPAFRHFWLANHYLHYRSLRAIFGSR